VSTWTTTLANKTSESAVASWTKTAQFCLKTYKKYLLKYKGGMPMGFLAAIMAFESGGQANAAGDESYGERGLFQVAASIPGRYGYPAEKRTDTEYNVFFGCLEYNEEAMRLEQKYAPYIIAGSKDQWLLARLVFAIGRTGTDTLLKATLPAFPRYVYAQILANVPANIEGSNGKMWYRAAMSAWAYQIGQKVFPDQMVGTPMKPPSPRGESYYLPKDVKLYTPNQMLAMSVATVAASVLLPGV
jgi:hypothetical protein